MPIKLTKEVFIKKSNNIHNNKYDYSKVEYNGSKNKVCIICPEHGEFWQTPSIHLKGCGCPKCKGEKNKLRCKSNVLEFISKAKEIHGDKYDYSKVEYINNRTKVCIICSEHGEFWQTPDAHLRGRGCSKCSVNSIKIKQSKTKECFIKDVNNIHNNKYDYSKVEYINNKTKVCIICPEHGEFWQTPNNHLKGKGCPSCYGNKKISIEEFINKSKKVHGDKYDYSKVEYINTDIKICIICPKHGEFWQTPYKHINKAQGCPYCKRSKLEETVKYILTDKQIKYTQEQCFEWLKYKLPLKLDFYLPDYNIAIECQGEQHFIPVNFGKKDKYLAQKNLKLNIERDNLKKKLCEENDIHIIYINYNDNIEEIKNKINNITYG